MHRPRVSAYRAATGFVVCVAFVTAFLAIHELSGIRGDGNALTGETPTPETSGPIETVPQPRIVATTPPTAVAVEVPTQVILPVRSALTDPPVFVYTHEPTPVYADSDSDAPRIDELRPGTTLRVLDAAERE